MKITESELKKLLVKNPPGIDNHGELVEEIGEGRVRIRLPFNEEYVGEDVWGRSGNRVFSGPITMGLAEPKARTYGKVDKSAPEKKAGKEAVAASV